MTGDNRTGLIIAAALVGIGVAIFLLSGCNGLRSHCGPQFAAQIQTETLTRCLEAGERIDQRGWEELLGRPLTQEELAVPGHVGAKEWKP